MGELRPVKMKRNGFPFLFALAKLGWAMKINTGMSDSDSDSRNVTACVTGTENTGAKLDSVVHYGIPG